MFATTTSRLDRFALRQLKGCAAEIIAATAAKNLPPTTGGTNEALRDRTRPEITHLMNRFLMHVRALNHTSQVDLEFERVKTCIARLPREEWVPCKGGKRHDELAKFEETYSMITREARWRGVMAAFEVALATYKCGQDDVEVFMMEARDDPTEETRERVEKGKRALAVVRAEVEKYTMEMIAMLQDFKHVVVAGYYYIPPQMPEICQCHSEGDVEEDVEEEGNVEEEGAGVEAGEGAAIQNGEDMGFAEAVVATRLH